MSKEGRTHTQPKGFTSRAEQNGLQWLRAEIPAAFGGLTDGSFQPPAS